MLLFLPHWLPFSQPWLLLLQIRVLAETAEAQRGRSVTALLLKACYVVDLGFALATCLLICFLNSPSW